MQTFQTGAGEVIIDQGVITERLETPNPQGRILFPIIVFLWFLFVILRFFAHVYFPPWSMWTMTLLLLVVFIIQLIRTLSYFKRRKGITVTLVSEISAAGLAQHSGRYYAILRLHNNKYRNVAFGKNKKVGQKFVEEIKKENSKIEDLTFEGELK